MKDSMISFRASKVDKMLIEREARRQGVSVSEVLTALWRSFNEYRDLLFKKKAYARTRLSIDLKAGKVEKMDCCLCGDKDTEAHHIDYSSPLNVSWLCKKCHKSVHNKRGA